MVSGKELRKETQLPGYTRGEEIFNMVSHIAGGALGIVVMAVCVVLSAVKGSVSGVVTSALYGTSMIAVYVISSVYHGLPPGKAKRVMRIIDHCTIYFLIGGTYTPILVCCVRKVDPVACWVTFFMVWVPAVTAAVLTAIDMKKFNVVSMICYVFTGWSILFYCDIAYRALTPAGFGWILAGGIAYTIGAIIYGIGKKYKWFHGIFHLFVVLGSLLQGIGVVFYVILCI